MLRQVFTNALALAAACLVVPGIHVTGRSFVAKATTLLVVALLFGVLNSLVKPLLTLLSAPLLVLTLGLFMLIVNGGMLLLTSWVSTRFGLGFHIDGWLPAVAGALIVSAVAWAVGRTWQRGRQEV